LFYFFGRRSKAVHLIALWSGVQFVFWATSSQQLRFLVPVFPAVSLLAANALQKPDWRAVFGIRLRVVENTLLIGGILFTILIQVIYTLMLNPMPYVLGMESKRQFLSRTVGNYQLHQYVLSDLSPDAQVQMLWDGRGYYCGERCLAGGGQLYWAWLINQGLGIDGIMRQLRADGTTHLLYSEPDAEFFITKDRSGLHRKAQAILLRRFVPACASVIAQVGEYKLYELTC
jgi:hypothetical protein